MPPSSRGASHELPPLRPGEELHLTVEAGDLGRLRECCEGITQQEGVGASTLSWQNTQGLTPLILCARTNKPAFAQVLLEHGADVHYSNTVFSSSSSRNWGTALHEAALRGFESVVRILLRHGANPWAANIAGSNAFDYAQLSGSQATIATIRERAEHKAEIKAKCALYYNDNWEGIWKECIAVVTRHYPFNRTSPSQAQKRVYLFRGSDPKARAILTYESGEATKDGRQKAELKMHDPDGNAVRQPYETSLQPIQNGMRVANKFKLATNLLSGALNLAHMSVAASPASFHLMTEGRKAHTPDSPSLMPQETSVFFCPTDATCIQPFNQFLASLEGPQNEAQREAAQVHRAVRVAHSQFVRLSDSPASQSYFDAILQQPPSDLQQTTVEPACVICLTEPCQRGYLHGNTMHACVCHSCVKVAPPGASCPICRQQIQGIAAL